MKTKIILLLVLLLIGLGDWSEHHFTCAAEEAQLLPISYTDEEIGRKGQKKSNPWQLCCERRDMGKRGACAAPVESSKDAFPASFLVGTGHMEHPFLRKR